MLQPISVTRVLDSEVVTFVLLLMVFFSESSAEPSKQASNEELVISSITSHKMEDLQSDQ